MNYVSTKSIPNFIVRSTSFYWCFLILHHSFGSIQLQREKKGVEESIVGDFSRDDKIWRKRERKKRLKLWYFMSFKCWAIIYDWVLLLQSTFHLNSLHCILTALDYNLYFMHLICFSHSQFIVYRILCPKYDAVHVFQGWCLFSRIINSVDCLRSGI